MTDATRWGHSTSHEPETWSGSFKTREEAIADGKDLYGESFYVKSGCVIDAYQAMPKADELMDRMGEYAYDNWVVPDGFPDVSAEAQNELNALLRAWCDKHLGDVEHWMCDGTKPERVELSFAECAALDLPDDPAPSSPTEP